MLGDLAGQREAFMYDEGRALFERRVKATIYPEAARLVAEHLADGHVVTVVDESILSVVEPRATSLDVAHVRCTDLDYVYCVLTGRCTEPR